MSRNSGQQEMESSVDVMGDLIDETDHRMDSGENSPFSISAPQSQPDPEDLPWDADDLTTQLYALAIRKPNVRKRKSDSTSSEDLPNSSVNLSVSDFKRQHIIAKFKTGAFTKVGTSSHLLERLFRYLSDNEIRPLIEVTNRWCETGKTKLKQRIGNRPFVRLWRSEPGVESKFLLRRFLYEAESGVEPVQAVLLAGTVKMEDSELMVTRPNELVKSGATCLLGLMDGFIVTTPDLHSFLEISDGSSEYACQALCVPKSDKLYIKGFAAIDRVGDDLIRFSESLESPPGLSLKGIILLLYGDEPDISNAIAFRLNKEPHPVPLVGGVVEFNRSSEHASRDQLASGFAFFGNDNLRITSCALEVDGIPQNKEIYPHMGQYFQTSENGLIFLFYRKNATRTAEILREIRDHVRVGIPVVGFEVAGEGLCFEGIIPGINATMYFPNLNPGLNIKMVAIFIAY